jgi:hypothetical protein
MWGGSLPGRGSRARWQGGSDQTAAEALQEAETEVGIAGNSLIGVRSGAVRSGGFACRSADPSAGLGLTA